MIYCSLFESNTSNKWNQTAILHKFEVQNSKKEINFFILNKNMKEITLGTTIKIYESVDELSPNDRKLLLEAKNAVTKSYAPYSNFKVSASVLLHNDKILSGGNQENASFPLCLCAEMVVMSTVASKYPNAKILTMAITVQSKNKDIDMPISPCGACRQTLLEYENRQGQAMRILLQGDKGPIYELESVKSLLPLSFDGSVL